MKVTKYVQPEKVGVFKGPHTSLCTNSKISWALEAPSLGNSMGCCLPLIQDGKIDNNFSSKDPNPLDINWIFLVCSYLYDLTWYAINLLCWGVWDLIWFVFYFLICL